jgi:GGDEF domain-containing protein
VIIRALADAIQRAVADMDDTLPGHIGGDDFVVVLEPEHAETFCRRVIQDFEELLPKAYPPEDYARGTVESQDRAGNVRSFPLVSLSIACVVQYRGNYTHVGALSRAAAEVKSYLKKQPGSSYLIDRRGGGG